MAQYYQIIGQDQSIQTVTIEELRQYYPNLTCIESSTGVQYVLNSTDDNGAQFQSQQVLLTGEQQIVLNSGEAPQQIIVDQSQIAYQQPTQQYTVQENEMVADYQQNEINTTQQVYYTTTNEYKLCKVKRVQTGPKGIPFLVTHDGRTIRYPDPIIKVNDTIQLEIANSKIMDSIKFDSGNLCMITGGRNLGRVGTVVNRERHPGSFDIVHIKDSQGHTFATRLNNVFIIGKGSKAYVSLPRGKGVKLSIAEERDKRLAAKTH